MSLLGEDFADVAGQSYAKRALEIAANGHNIFMCRSVATDHRLLQTRCEPPGGKR